jgi:hypothetical protein
MDAIQYTYPTVVYSIFNSNADIKYPYILAVDILPYKKTEYITLGPILDSKTSINSNYYIMENIFLKQLQYNYKTAFNNWLFLVYKD